jgi:hypothetical protein
MGSYPKSAAKHRLQVSTFLLVLVCLCSIASPHRLRKAVVQHHAPIQSARTFRDLTRSRSSSSRTSAEAEIEPEIPVTRTQPVLTSTLHLAPSITSTAAPRHTLTTVALLPQPPPAVSAPRLVCISRIAQDDPSIVSTLGFRPHLGRAPPLA